jgi:hypothetical protein
MPKRGSAHVPAAGRYQDSAQPLSNAPLNASAPSPRPSPLTSQTASGVLALQSLRRHSSAPPERDVPVPGSSSHPPDAGSAPLPSVALLPVADYAAVFREYEQRASLFSHTDAARTLWSQVNVACSVSMLKQSLLAAFECESACMQAARQQCLQRPHFQNDIDLSGMQRNSLAPVAEALVQGLLLASSRINRVTLSLFGHALAPSPYTSPDLPRVQTLPPYAMRPPAPTAQLPPLSPAAIAAAGLPAVVHAHELLHWSCGQDLTVHAHLSLAPWGACLAGCDAAPSATGTQDAAEADPASAPVRQWARAREDALMELGHSEIELQAARGHSASITLPGDIGTVVLHGSGVQQLTLYDIVLARHAATFAAPLLCATACAMANDLFCMSASLCAGSLAQHLARAPSPPHALHAIRDTVKSVFRCDAVTASFFASASTLLCCSRQRAADVTQDGTSLLSFARESQLPLLVTSPLDDPRYNPAVDFCPDMLPAPSASSTCSLLIVPCVARAHASASTAVLGFLQVARAHAPSCAVCCFSAVELRCVAKLAEAVATLITLKPQCLQAAAAPVHAPGSSTLSSSSKLRQGDAASPKLSLPSASDAAAAPLSATLLQLLSERRDLALQLFRATSQPHADPRLHRIACMALEHADAPRATSVQQLAPPPTPPPRATSARPHAPRYAA